jgi:cellulose synthase/poly-beta-1,6-N-acetylglucosamine synthase-like glycosyltransferase
LLHVILVGAVWMGALLLFVILPVNFAFTPRLSLSRAPAVRRLRVSVIIPARDEERCIERAVRSHLSQAYPDLEVVAVNDRSSDRTGEILVALAQEDSRLRVVTGSEPPDGWLGKPHALHLGASAATGEVLLFADADVVYDPRTLGEAVSLLESGRLDFVALLPRFATEGFWESVLMPYVLGAYFTGIGFLSNVDWPRWVAAGGGAGNLIRRPVYEALGGHAALKDSVVDDVHLAFRAKRAGFRTRAVRAEDRVSVRMYRGLFEVVNGFTKNIGYVLQGFLGAMLFVLTAVITLFWVVPPLVTAAALLGAPVATQDVLIAAAGFALVVAARLAAAAALNDKLWPAVTHPIMAAIWGFIICRSLYHRIVRGRLVWRGREFDARAARF